MPQLRNRLLYECTRTIHRVYPRIPIVRHAPNAARIVKYVRDRIRPRILWRLAARHRRRLDNTTCIGIVGSAGKTMTKLMAWEVLSAKYQGSVRRDSANYPHTIPECVLMVRPSDQFCVIELSAGKGPGSLRRTVDLLKPRIGVVTCIGTDHYSAFGSQDAIALEKGRLIRELPEEGVAVLNADDPRVIAMRSDCRARVISFGMSADADVRAECVRAAWPDRLSFELVHDGRRVLVQTRLCGEHWVPGALAAAAVGIAMDVPLPDIARSLGRVESYMARMSPVVLPDGVAFIRDDWKASAQTIPPAFEFLRAARATRKLAVIGTLSDYWGNSRAYYVKTARYALEVSDIVIFVGSRASAALRARPADEPDRLRAFATVESATAFLSDFLEPGDLVLLKGSNPADHLYRIALSRTSPVSCWRGDCRRTRFCDECELVAVSPGEERQPAPEAAASTGLLVSGKQIVVGLGNPGDKYANTPHNVGYAVLDRIAAEARAEWAEDGRARVALVEWRDLSLCLVKPKSVMNHSGRVLHELFVASGIEPGDVVLVFDDNDLPLGKVRRRVRGSDGGHRGVRSILEAFQTAEFRRIKIGVRRDAGSEGAREAVLRAFDKAEEPLVSAAMDQACSRLQEMIRDSKETIQTTLPPSRGKT